MAYLVRARQRNAPHRRELWANASARSGGPSSFSDLILLFVLSPPISCRSTTLPRSGSRVRIPSPAPVISSMKLIGCDASQVTNKAPDSLSGGTLGGTKAVPRSLKRYSNKPSPTVLTTSPGRLYEADQPGPKRAKQVTRQQGHGPTGPPGSITA